MTRMEVMRRTRMEEPKGLREYGLDNTLADTFPCSDPLSSIPNPNDPTYQELRRDMATPIQHNKTTRRYVQRECPICGYTQLVAASEFQDSLICDNCDYVIPARKKAA